MVSACNLPRMPRKIHRFVVALIALLTALGLAVGLGQSAHAEVGAEVAAKLRVVTANVNFGNGPAKVREDIKRYRPKADVILFQEVKNVDLKNFFNLDNWKVLQNTSSKAKAGSAVVYRKSVVSKQVNRGLHIGTRPHGKDILTRWINWVDVKLVNGTVVRLASLHMPPARYPGLQDNMVRNTVDFIKKSPHPVLVGGDWNFKVNNDPKNITGKTGLKARGKGIDGFYFAAKTVKFVNIKRLAKGNSDHHPVRMVVKVG